MNKLNLKNGEGYLLTDTLYIRYFTNLVISEGYLLVGSEIALFTDARYFSAVKEKLNGSDIKCLLYQGDFSIKEEIERQNLSTLFLDYESTTLAENARYKNFKVKLKNGTARLQKLREIKTEQEISNIKRACEIIETVLSQVKNIIKLGVTEEEIAEYIKTQVVKMGAEDIAFETIVAFGKHSAVPHHKTGKTRLKNNQCILIDTGAMVNGYRSDITRTYFFGKPTKEFVDNYNAVLKANLLALDYAKAGRSLKQVDALARDYLKDKGVGEYFTHSLGHGIGLAIHEQPRLSKNARGVLKENMAFTIEPGVYFDDKYGIRIEDTAIISNGKATRLYKDSKELIIIT